MVVFSVERLIAVYFPLKCNSICTSGKNKSCILFVSLFGIALYSVSLKTTGITEYDSVRRCAPLEVWHMLAKYMTLFHIVITMLIPFIVITVLNALITIKLTAAKTSFIYSRQKNRASEATTTTRSRGVFYSRTSNSEVLETCLVEPYSSSRVNNIPVLGKCKS